MKRKFSYARINIAKNGFVINFNDGGSLEEFCSVAHTLDEVREILDEKLDMSTQE